mgnify:CR=1 FL=1
MDIANGVLGFLIGSENLPTGKILTFDDEKRTSRSEICGVMDEGLQYRTLRILGADIVYRVTDSVVFDLNRRHCRNGSQRRLAQIFSLDHGVGGNAGTFVASEILAKHDERYMPKEVADELKAQGMFHPDPAKPGS